MSMWDFLNWLELQDIKDKISRSHVENSSTNNSGNTLEKIFLQLYRNNNDISKIDLSLVPYIKEKIFGEFKRNASSNRSLKDSYSFKIIVIFIIAMTIFSILSINLFVLKDENLNFFNLMILIISGITSLGGFLSLLDTFKYNKSNYEYLKENLPIALELKNKYSYLTPYGLYLKHYIDNTLKDIIKLLEKNSQKGDPYKTLEVLYGLFDLKASTKLMDEKYNYFFWFFNRERFNMLNDNNYVLPKENFKFEKIFLILLILIPIIGSLFFLREKLINRLQVFFLKREIIAFKNHDMKSFVFSGKIACFLGSKDACSIIGLYYRDKEKDLDTALKYFKKACLLGEYKSCIHTGYILCHEYSMPSGIKYYKIACKKGHIPFACINVGSAYANELCKQNKNLTKAKNYFKLGCDLGDKNSCTFYNQVLNLLKN
jgi:TPR repeat protein